MEKFRLSEHFTVAEFERSAYATAHGIDNTVPSQYIPRLEQLCKTILEPFREYVVATTPPKQGEKEGVLISSGFRSPIVNMKIGGVPASQHTMGEAADIRIPKTPYTDWDDNKAHTDMDIAHRWFTWLETHTDFDQLILETENGRDYWIHISCKKNRSKNRHQVFRDMCKHSKAED